MRFGKIKSEINKKRIRFESLDIAKVALIVNKAKKALEKMKSSFFKETDNISKITFDKEDLTVKFDDITGKNLKSVTNRNVLSIFTKDGEFFKTICFDFKKEIVLLILDYEFLESFLNLIDPKINVNDEVKKLLHKLSLGGRCNFDNYEVVYTFNFFDL